MFADNLHRHVGLTDCLKCIYGIVVVVKQLVPYADFEVGRPSSSLSCISSLALTSYLIFRCFFQTRVVFQEGNLYSQRSISFNAIQ